MTEAHELALRALRDGPCTISALAHQLRRTQRETRSLVSRLKTHGWVQTNHVRDAITSETETFGRKCRIQPIVVARLTPAGYEQSKDR